jgi:hypothetical protein
VTEIPTYCIPLKYTMITNTQQQRFLSPRYNCGQLTIFQYRRTQHLSNSGSVRLTNFMQILCDFSGPRSSPKKYVNYPKLSVKITYYKQLNYNLLISARLRKIFD